MKNIIGYGRLTIILWRIEIAYGNRFDFSSSFHIESIHFSEIKYTRLKGFGSFLIMKLLLTMRAKTENEAKITVNTHPQRSPYPVSSRN